MLKRGDVIWDRVSAASGAIQIHIIMGPRYNPTNKYTEYLVLRHIKNCRRNDWNGEWKKDSIFIWPDEDYTKYIVRNKTRLNIIYNSLMDHLSKEKMKLNEELYFFDGLLNKK